MLQALKQGASGPDVVRWQEFLIGQGYVLIADGDFGKKTFTATASFQAAHQIIGQIGVVDNQTAANAARLGFEIVADAEGSHLGPNWPPPPSFKPLVSTVEREAAFGKFVYSPKPDGNITIHGSWARDNIASIFVPQLAGIQGAPANSVISFHKLAKQQLLTMFDEWERAGLSSKILSWAGSFVPRLQRGSKTALSNHAFGTAFDINAPQNALGAIPALVGRTGSVRELVEIACRHGFYWGGHFTRKDGMHFEVARLL